MIEKIAANDSLNNINHNNRKVKVIYVLSGTNMGGATLSFLTLLRGVMDAGNSVVVVIPNADGSFIGLLDSINVNHYVIPLDFDIWPRLYGIKRFLGYPYVLIRFLYKRNQSIKLLSNVIEIEKPDLVHTNVSPLSAGYFASQKCGVPHVWHIREYCDKDFGMRLFPSKRRYRKYLAQSYSISITHNLAVHNGLIANPKSYVVYNGVRSKNSIHFNQEKENYFLCASRISEEKGHERVIRVFSQFLRNNSDYRLVLLGDGYDYYIERCKTLARQLGVEQNVIFEGFKTNVDDYMSKAKALIVASPSEGFGRMTAEAAFSGCLVVGYNSGGTKEILESTGGFLWNTDEEFLNCMTGVASMSIDEYRVMALRAQRVAMEIFSTESYLSEVLEVYNHVLTKTS